MHDFITFEQSMIEDYSKLIEEHGLFEEYFE
jgi:hypothetical protein